MQKNALGFQVMNFISIFILFFFTCTICNRFSRMDASVCGLPALSYPDSCSCDHAGDLIGGFSTLLPVVACNYCYRPPSSFKLLLFFFFLQLTAISGQKLCIKVAGSILYHWA